jgi:hypothetical protein
MSANFRRAVVCRAAIRVRSVLIQIVALQPLQVRPVRATYQGPRQRATIHVDREAANYKCLAEIERGFRTLKGIDLSVRPIRHILLSMLAYYVQ